MKDSSNDQNDTSRESPLLHPGSVVENKTEPASVDQTADGILAIPEGPIPGQDVLVSGSECLRDRYVSGSSGNLDSDSGVQDSMGLVGSKSHLFLRSKAKKKTEELVEDSDFSNIVQYQNPAKAITPKKALAPGGDTGRKYTYNRANNENPICPIEFIKQVNCFRDFYGESCDYWVAYLTASQWKNSSPSLLHVKVIAVINGETHVALQTLLHCADVSSGVSAAYHVPKLRALRKLMPVPTDKIHIVFGNLSAYLMINGFAFPPDHIARNKWLDGWRGLVDFHLSNPDYPRELQIWSEHFYPIQREGLYTDFDLHKQEVFARCLARRKAADLC